MEKGLKNLHAANRSAQRKERGKDDSGDSGIGGSDAENEIDDSHSGVAQSALHIQPNYTNPRQRGGPSIQSMLSPTPAQEN